MSDGDVLALRFDNWKVVFMEQRAQGTLRIWADPFVVLRVPKLRLWVCADGRAASVSGGERVHHLHRVWR